MADHGVTEKITEEMTSGVVEVALCTDDVDCALPAGEHDEDTDCPAVVWSSPRCEHRTTLISCRVCAADPPAGRQLVDCDEGHPVVWVRNDQRGYPPSCPYCLSADLIIAHARCAHARHGRWRSWRPAHWLVGWLAWLGILAAHGTTSGGGCPGCLTFVRWRGQRSHILGWPTWKWECVLVLLGWRTWKRSG